MASGSRGATLLESLAIGEIEGLDVRVDEPMAKHTTLRLGGPADLWIRPARIDALAELLRRTHAAGVSTHFIGSGTNLLVRDGGLRGVAINLGKLAAVAQPDPDGAPEVVTAEAGASTGRLLKFATERSLGGIEFLGGVPGTVGGGLIMNAGTYLGEFTDVVQSVDSLTQAGTRVRRTHAECGFRYRDSDLPVDEIAVATTLRLHPRDRADIEADVRELRARRKAREPAGVPNNGSTFKNPEGDYAGRLIETAGLKGARRGGAVVSPVHANWLVVDREVDPPCTSRDLLALIDHVRTEVARTHGITLTLEVKVVGEDP